MGTKPGLGIIGFGQFGAFMARHLQADFEVCSYDFRPEMAEQMAASGVQPVSFEVCAGQPVVILAVPFESLGEMLVKIRPHLKAGAVVVDVCSVKIASAALFKQYLPENVDYLCTHPLFGPQSGKNGLLGMEMIVCPGRGRAARAALLKLARRWGLKTVRMTADAHDRQMAHVMALTHLVGRTLVNMQADGQLPAWTNHTRSYRHLLELSALLKWDSEALFRTIQLANPHAAAVRDAFSAELGRTLALLD